MRFFDTYIEPSKIRYKITVDLIIKDFVLKAKSVAEDRFSVSFLTPIRLLSRICRSLQKEAAADDDVTYSVYQI